MALDFARKVKFGEAADIIVTQQRFIATMQGRTTTLSTFSDAQFNEAAFEARLTTGRMPLLPCMYWILKLKARFLSGDYAEALVAVDKVKPLLGVAVGQTQHFDYIYYTALTAAALYETTSADQQQAWRELLTAHREQLREWAENNPPTFADKYTLVLAEIARLEKRDADVLRLYEEAIHSAREHGFVQNEGLAHELAALYYLARGIETAGYAYLRNARNCYDRWGAQGKVKQLEERYPRLREERTPAASADAGPPVVQLDVETVVKASQAISSEMVLPRLIEKLLRIAVENAGAERGLLILIRGASRGWRPKPPLAGARLRLRFGRQPSRRPTSRNPCCITSSGPRSACSSTMLPPKRSTLKTSMCGRIAPIPSCACPLSSRRSLSAHFIWRTTSLRASSHRTGLPCWNYWVRRPQFRWRTPAFIPLCTKTKASFNRSSISLRSTFMCSGLIPAACGFL